MKLTIDQTYEVLALALNELEEGTSIKLDVNDLKRVEAGLLQIEKLVAISKECIQDLKSGRSPNEL